MTKRISDATNSSFWHWTKVERIGFLSINELYLSKMNLSGQTLITYRQFVPEIRW